MSTSVVTGKSAGMKIVCYDTHRDDDVRICTKVNPKKKLSSVEIKASTKPIKKTDSTTESVLKTTTTIGPITKTTCSTMSITKLTSTSKQIRTPFITTDLVLKTNSYYAEVQKLTYTPIPKSTSTTEPIQKTPSYMGLVLKTKDYNMIYRDISANKHFQFCKLHPTSTPKVRTTDTRGAQQFGSYLVSYTILGIAFLWILLVLVIVARKKKSASVSGRKTKSR